MRYCILLWPGFARAWHRGEVYSTLVAILFGVSLSITWIATFHWTDWFAGAARGLAWLALVVAVVWSLVRGIMGWSLVFGEPATSSRRQTNDEAFRAAQQAYLRGEYFEAEAALHPIFVSGSEDAESALLLAGILRRTNRTDQALQTLDRLSKLDSAGPWFTEIHRERSLCQRKTAA